MGLIELLLVCIYICLFNPNKCYFVFVETLDTFTSFLDKFSYIKNKNKYIYIVYQLIAVSNITKKTAVNNKQICKLVL